MPTTAPQTLPQHCYHSDEVFQFERQHIFAKHWWMIAPQQQFQQTGDYLATQLGDWPIVIRRDEDQKLRGFHNVCRHRAGPLLRDGIGQCKEFVCRYHAWRYDGCGHLLKTPGLKRDEELDYEKLSLFPIRVECWHQMVFVCLDEQAPNLLSWLGDIIDIAKAYPQNNSMNFLAEVEKSGLANWKVYGDNSCEGYHVGMVHQNLGSAMQRETVEIKAYPNGEFVGFDVTYQASDSDQTRDGKGFWVYKFPGLLLHFSEYAFNVESVFPLSSNRINLRRWFWVDDDEMQRRQINPAEMQAASEQVMQEDIEICELVQRNLEAGIYQSGFLSSRQEVGTIYFQQLVRRALGNLQQ